MKNETTLMTTSTPVRYYVGDLCYVMHDVWDEVCDLTFPLDGDEVNGELELADGRKFIIYGTAYGDGVYYDREGKSYGVDSGTIGAIKVDDIRDPEFARIIEDGHGQVHEFPAEIDGLDCFYESGTIGIYRVEINTAGDWEEEEEEEEEGFSFTEDV
jgi:hypothetical protein